MDTSTPTDTRNQSPVNSSPVASIAASSTHLTSFRTRSPRSINQIANTCATHSWRGCYYSCGCAMGLPPIKLACRPILPWHIFNTTLWWDRLHMLPSSASISPDTSATYINVQKCICALTLTHLACNPIHRLFTAGPADHHLRVFAWRRLCADQTRGDVHLVSANYQCAAVWFRPVHM